MCNFEEIKNLAQLIDHIPIPIRAKYTFAISPINARNPFITSCFVKFVRSYSNDDPITIEFLKSIINWPLKMPSNLNELIHLENVFDVLDLYLWLSFRFPVIFFQTSEVIQLRQELEQIIYSGVKKLLSKEKGNKRLQINKNISFSSSLNSQKEIINVLKINEIDDINKVQAEKYLNTDYK
jgi:ATP-dependent RNA helicase SUPV3L1/SUV3